MGVFKRLEWCAGRRRAERDAPRPLDLDLVLYDSLESRRPELALPHPRARRRRFVLEPLAALAPEWPVPPDGATIAELVRRAPSSPALEPVAWGDLEALDDPRIDRSAALA